MSDEKKKIAFLFGAGAEVGDNFNLPSGFEYMRKSVLERKAGSEYRDALQKFFQRDNYFGSYKYRRDVFNTKITLLQNLLMSEIKSNPDFIKENGQELSIMLSDDNIKQLKQYEEIRDIIETVGICHKKDAIKREQIEKEFSEILKEVNPKYSNLKTNLLKNLFHEKDNGEIDVHFNVGIAGMFDKYFHTIANPVRYSEVNFSKILNYYWACYFTIIEGVVNNLVKSNFILKKYYDKDKLDYSKILNNIKQFTEEIYSISDKNIDCDDSSYYKIIRKELENRKNKVECVGVATTNYYKFAEIVHHNVLYLNGKLSLFEFPEILEVKNVLDADIKVDGSKLFFPFIFGQSFTKPIVNREQIETFYRFSSLLENADFLIILGFNINEDDNHINAFLHDYVKNKKIILVHNQDEHLDIKERLRLDDNSLQNIVCCPVNFGDKNQNIVDKIFEKIYEIAVI